MMEVHVLRLMNVASIEIFDIKENFFREIWLRKWNELNMRNTDCANPCQSSCIEPNREPYPTFTCSKRRVCQNEFIRIPNDASSTCVAIMITVLGNIKKIFKSNRVSIFPNFWFNYGRKDLNWRFLFIHHTLSCEILFEVWKRNLHTNSIILLVEKLSPLMTSRSWSFHYIHCLFFTNK
jgi:hypothetical protein